MSNVLDIQMNEHIVLDPERTKDMPDEFKGHLTAMISHAARKHKCHWSKITWSVTIEHNEPIIKVKHG
jgi:hypothetical protein